MTALVIEIVAIFVLLAVNGVFAMTEIAVVSARRPRLRLLADQGDERARAALQLIHAPNRFLSTVQIGISLIGVMAGAFGGATIAGTVRDALQALPALAPYGDAIGFATVVTGITFFSLVLGELAPKRIGLNNPERIAMFMAKPMQKLSNLAGPLVNFLAASTDASLRILGFKEVSSASVTEEDVKALMHEGMRSGAFNRVETQIVSSALDLDQLVVRDIMTPRRKVICLNREDTHEAIWRKIVASAHSFFPVYEQSRDNIIGIVSVKAIYANLAVDVTPNIADLMTQPMVVPATQTVIQLLETFKQTGKHIALVTDEFGSIVGLATLHDVMEAMVGDFPPLEERLRPQAKKREDGSWLIDAMLEIDKLEGLLAGLTFGDQESDDYQTLAGFVVKHLGRVPQEGDRFEFQGYNFEILDMDRHRVDKVLLTRRNGGTATSGGATQAPPPVQHP
jgi:putative hemolysin